MPRNPSATRCSIPNCRSWAMRGHTRCRAHRDAELGPRGAGAPPGNLNALRHGAYSHPLSPTELDALARRIVDHPGDLADCLGALLHDLQAHLGAGPCAGPAPAAGHPLRALLVLHHLLPQLIARVAALLFDAELEAYVSHLPPEPRAALCALLRRSLLPAARPGDPLRPLLLLRQVIRRRTRQARQ